MSRPTIGQVYRGKGGARQVVNVCGSSNTYTVVWRRPGKDKLHECWCSTWEEFAKTTTVAEAKA